MKKEIRLKGIEISFLDSGTVVYIKYYKGDLYRTDSHGVSTNKQLLKRLQKLLLNK